MTGMESIYPCVMTVCKLSVAKMSDAFGLKTYPSIEPQNGQGRDPMFLLILANA